MPGKPGVHGPGSPHEQREQARPQEIAHGLAHLQRRLRKGGSPLAHGLLGRAGTHHQQHEQPEHPAARQLAHAHAPALPGHAADRHSGKIKTVKKWHQRPDKGQYPPVSNSGHPEKHGGGHDHQHMSPAVEGVQQAHGRLLALRGARLHDRADHHLDQSAARRVQQHRPQKSQVGVRRQLRQNPQPGHAPGAEQVGQYNGPPVPDPVHKPGGQKIHQQLDRKVHGHQQGDLIQ